MCKKEVTSKLLDDKQIEIDERQVKIDAKFYEQEHRLFVLFSNWYETRIHEKGDLRRKNATKAVLWRIFSSIFSVNSLAIGGASVVGFITILIMVHANNLLQSQNKLSGQQTLLTEAARRQNLSFEMTNIQDKIYDEVNSELLLRKSGKSAYKKTDLIRLSAVLEARIISLSHVFKPYYYVSKYNEGTLEVEFSLKYLKRLWNSVIDHSSIELTEKMYSPERGYLLISLIRSNIDVSKIVVYGSFNYAELPKIDFDNVKLVGARLSRAELNKIKLRDATLNGADLRYSNLSGALLNKSDFIGAYFREADLTGAELKGVDLSGAFLNDTDLRGAFLNDAVLRGTKLNGIAYKDADFSGAKLTNATWINGSICKKGSIGKCIQ